MPHAETKKPNVIEQVKLAVANFEATQKKYKEFGAYDTEPDGIWQGILDKAVKGEAPNPPRTGAGWDLYTSSEDCTEAALALFEAALKAVQAIEACPVRELATLREYIKKYCWRIY
jgi:hypothetical protein